MKKSANYCPREILTPVLYDYSCEDNNIVINAKDETGGCHLATISVKLERHGYSVRIDPFTVRYSGLMFMADTMHEQLGHYGKLIGVTILAP